MGHRDVKRVPLDFDWPLGKVWEGYLLPDALHEQSCESCDGSGYSSDARHLQDRWYGEMPFDPSDTGSTPLTAETAAVRAFAERNVSDAPDFYGKDEAAIVREATRLATMWNSQWSHHLDQDDVDALLAAGRLMDFTHTIVRGEGWKPIEPTPTVTAEQVNEWSLRGIGHDGINCWVVIKAKCERLGVSETCAKCEGQGSTEKYPGQRAEAEAWTDAEPPEGEGWQLWETTSEGSPSSPVFKTPEALARWCEDNATVFASMKATYAEWMRMIVGDTLDVGSLAISVGGGPLTFLQREGEMRALDPDEEPPR